MLKNVNNLKISCNDADIQIATKAINDGAIVVFPTDTVYGLGCNPYNHDAVQSIYEIKKRNKTKPFPVIGYSKKELEKIAEFNPLEEKIAEKFWPGPITLILKIKDKEIQKSLDLKGKIAVRVPNNQCVLALLKECKLLVGTSANISGTTPFNDPKECSKNLSGYDLLIDGGMISGQGESTIVEIENNDVKILRKGNVSEEMIKELT
jgi:L-threonylcarbamoyladenylate synthase